MAPNDVYLVLEKMIAGLEPNPAETKMISSLLDTIKRWELIIEFYSKGNYDKGLIARDALGTMTDDDKRRWADMKFNSHNLSPENGQNNS